MRTLLTIAMLVIRLLACGDAVIASDAVRVPLVRDTIYHAIWNVAENSITVAYGAYPLVGCSVVARTSAETFVESWDSRTQHGWQTVKSRRAFAARPSVSDTIVEVVAQVSRADPRDIQRIVPDRFRIDLSGSMSVVFVTPRGDRQGADFRESMDAAIRQLVSLGRQEVLTIWVSESDAQTLYYALEPGTPVILRGRRLTPAPGVAAAEPQ